MTDTLDRIDGLSDDQVLEAVNLISADLLGATPDREVRANVARLANVEPSTLDESIESATPKEVADLGRLVLVAAVVAGREQDVDNALDAIGQKALLIEIAVIGILALGALHLLQTRGRKEEIREEEITVAPDGRVTIKTRDSVRYYTVGDSLAPLAEKLLGAIIPS